MIGNYIKATNDIWTRPTDWLPMPTVNITDDTFVGLYAIFPNGNNFATVRFTTSAGQYQVDWGDGTVTLHNSNTTAEYQYNYNTYDTGNTTLTSRGYKQAIIKVTAVSGLLRTIDLQQRYTGTVNNYTSGFLDCILSMPNANTGASIIIGNLNSIGHRLCERFDIKTIGNCTVLTDLFSNFISLQSVALFDTSSVTTMSFMFQDCSSIKNIPLFNTSSVTNMGGIFQRCVSLVNAPLFNTSSLSTMNSLFDGCASLKNVPLYNTSLVTSMSQLFQGCTSLKSVPLFDTNLVTSIINIFNNCISLQSVPFFNTSLVTNMNNMFNQCRSLSSIPQLSTNSITETSGTDFGTFVVACSNLRRCEVIFARNVILNSSTLNQTAIEEILTNLVSRVSTSATITLTGNYGLGTIVSKSVTTTSGSKTITAADTSNLVAGMQVTGTGSPLSTPVAVTFQDAGDTVTLVAHGLENGDEVSFATIVSTTGLVLNTIYYIVNKTTDTFQLASTVGGLPLPLTTNGSGTMRHRTEIVSIVPNTSITMSRPMRASGTNTLAFRTLKTGTALLKNWAVTG
jgi:surface protein